MISQNSSIKKCIPKLKKKKIALSKNTFQNKFCKNCSFKEIHFTKSFLKIASSKNTFQKTLKSYFLKKHISKNFLKKLLPKKIRFKISLLIFLIFFSHFLLAKRELFKHKEKRKNFLILSLTKKQSLLIIVMKRCFSFYNTLFCTQPVYFFIFWKFFVMFTTTLFLFIFFFIRKRCFTSFFCLLSLFS